MILSLYTPKEVCKEFQMSITALYRNLHGRNIPYIKVGSIYRIIPDGFLEQDLTSLFPEKLKTKDLCNILKLSAPSAYNLIQQDIFPVDHYGERTLRIPRDSFFSWLRLSSVRPAKKISVEDVSSFIDNIILSGGIYHG